MERKFKFAPLNGAFMATSMIGGLISILWVYPKDMDWGVTFTVVFGLMFVASIISMTVADPDLFVELERKDKKKK
jgi:hypothetical protein